MDESSPNLGVCFFSDRLFYAISDPENNKHLSRIGSFDFNFEVTDAIFLRHPDHFPHVKSTFDKLREQYNFKSVRALTHPVNECWTALPKIVYDNSDEREDHMSIIMKGVDRQDLEPTWHSVSKTQYKFLCIRRRSVMEGFDSLTEKTATTEYLSDFEIAHRWSQHHKPGGSFMMIGCHNNLISVTSFMLGKFRAATFIKYDQAEDLPYHWLQHSAQATWMKGLHERTYLFGHASHEINRVLHTFWDQSSEIINLNSLSSIDVHADEETYGFDLAEAFPAIMLALDS